MIITVDGIACAGTVDAGLGDAGVADPQEAASGPETIKARISLAPYCDSA
jgi:hypothetical protein